MEEKEEREQPKGAASVLVVFWCVSLAPCGAVCLSKMRRSIYMSTWSVLRQ
ncbi:hypothetical protein RchiOBHm_Chr4g0420911 [Rosa chinensis]|uniref:Uncharacterized protein n=1 Tax=Rosa chinensis TaxID=74649 RepID=A0A2P6QY16_ROSCH|nr:hypothetical protein RchiOBHm_Chr4g0420911 [Rosa chinensis]